MILLEVHTAAITITAQRKIAFESLSIVAQT